MLDKIKELKLNITLSAVVMVVLGVVLLFWPASVSLMIGKVVGALLIATGAIQIVGNLMADSNRTMGLIVAAIILVFGIYIFVNPGIVVSVIPIIFGMILVIHGVQDIAMAFEGRSYQAPRWGVSIVLGIVNIILGLLCIACAFGIINMIISIIGIMLIYDGITDMLIVHRVNKASRYVDSEILHEEDIDEF